MSGGYDSRYDTNQLIKSIQTYNSKVKLIKQNHKVKIKNGQYIKVIHIPQHGVDQGNDFFLYGHVHGQKFKRNGFNVGIDCNNYMPVDLDTVLFFKNAIINFYDNNVFIEKI